MDQQGCLFQKGNPTRVDYRLKPFRANKLADIDDTSEHSEQGNDQTNENNFGLGIENMTNEEFNQYVGQIYAVRKMEEREEVLKEEERVRIDAQYVGGSDIYQPNVLTHRKLSSRPLMSILWIKNVIHVRQ